MLLENNEESVELAESDVLLVDDAWADDDWVRDEPEPNKSKGNVPPDEPVSDGDESRELEEPDESNGQIACAWLIKMDPIISFKLTFIVGRKSENRWFITKQ